MRALHEVFTPFRSPDGGGGGVKRKIFGKLETSLTRKRVGTVFYCKDSGKLVQVECETGVLSGVGLIEARTNCIRELTN